MTERLGDRVDHLRDFRDDGYEFVDGHDNFWSVTVPLDTTPSDILVTA